MIKIVERHDICLKHGTVVSLELNWCIISWLGLNRSFRKCPKNCYKNKSFPHFTSMGESHSMCHQSDLLHLKYCCFVFRGKSYNESNLSLRMMAPHKKCSTEDQNWLLYKLFTLPCTSISREYFSEFSGVCFSSFSSSEFVWSIIQNVEYFSRFFNQTEVRIFSGLLIYIRVFRGIFFRVFYFLGYSSEFFCKFFWIFP